VTATRDLLFEIGVEEIPSAALYHAIAQLRELAVKALDDARLEYAEVRTYGAPRRLVLMVDELAERQADQHLRVKGPSVRAAFDAESLPTKAAEGFARGKGIAVEDLVQGVDEAGGEYVFGAIDSVGRPASDVLPELLSELVIRLDWPKSQRWGAGSVRFIRPVRSLTALYGGDVVAAGFGDVVAGRVVAGHRFIGEQAIDLPSAGDYDVAAERGCFVYDQDERARLIREGVAARAAEMGATAVVPDKTFAEVVNLVEWPTVAVGRFDADFLSVPREVLETAMESHQRYFPLQGEDGALLNAFVVVHNGDPDRTERIVKGHERVIRARLADAAFFYREDLAASIEGWVEGLDRIVFQEKLGTLAAKVARVETLTGALAELSHSDHAVVAEAMRAAHLCKADLVSHVVIEFPSLQGVMGRYYAEAAGESPAVAQAIVEHYRPRYAGDVIPESVQGMLVSAADKLDTMVGIFAIGSAPTGSADPYALRRGTIGLLTMVLDGGLAITLDESIAAALDGYAGVFASLDRDTVGTAVKEFVSGRLEGMLRDRGHAFDTVAAVLAVACDDPSDALARVEALTPFRDAEAFRDLAIAYGRSANLCKPELGTNADASLMGDVERALADAVARAEGVVGEAMRQRAYSAVLDEAAALRDPIDAFFDGVLVMDPDAALRDMRLRLLNRFVSVFASFADFARLDG
jgi:glycyl-tRNA synthetase beta chain